MQRPLFVGEGRRCHSLSELRDLYASGARGERAALLDELGTQYRSGRLAPWLCSCLREGVRSKRVTFATAEVRRTSAALRTWMDARCEKARQLLGSAEMPAMHLTFDVLREGVLDPDADGPLLEELLCELVGAEAPVAPGAAGASGDAGAEGAAASLPPAPGAAEPGAPSAAGAEHGAPRVAPFAHAGSHEQERRHECARYPWYEQDGLADLADWSRVACSNDELQRILLAIADERAACEGRGPDASAPEVAEIHLCQVDEGTSGGFDLGSGRFPRTRFVAHGNPALIVSDPLAVQMAGSVGCIPGAVEGTSYTGSYRFVVQRPAWPGPVGTW